jgi:hypothetical protein
MKTKTFLLVCLFLSMALTQLSAQNGKNGNGTIVYDFIVTWTISWPITCDGVLVDQISNPYGMTIPVRDHFKNGVIVRELSSENGIEFTSDLTQEKFKVQGSLERAQITAIDPITGWATAGTDYFQMNLIGDMGSHYIVHLKTDIATWNSEYHIICPCMK